MSAPPFMPLYVAEYLGDTQHLSAEEHGAYLLLLMSMWRVGGGLPNEPAKLARIARINPRRWHLVAAVVLEFFDETDGFLTHGRLEREREKVRSISGKRSTAGKAAAAAKALRNNKRGSTHEPRLNNHLESYEEESLRSSSSQSQSEGASLRSVPSTGGSSLRSEPDRSVAPPELPLSIKPTPSGFALTTMEPAPPPAMAGPAALRGFEEFWRQYIRKVGKDAARKAYAAALKRGATPGQILQGAMRYAAERQHEDPAFTKHPSTWLNAGCWNDEPAPRQQSAGQRAYEIAMHAAGVTGDET